MDEKIKTWPLRFPAKENPNIKKARGPFLESPGNFTGPKSNIQIEI